MTEYSRHTTTKGQLLLNIKPPSVDRSPQKPANFNGNPQINSKYVPYTGMAQGGNSRHLQPQTVIMKPTGQTYMENNYQGSYQQGYGFNRVQPAPTVNSNVYAFGAQGQGQGQQEYRVDSRSGTQSQKPASPIYYNQNYRNQPQPNQPQTQNRGQYNQHSNTPQYPQSNLQYPYQYNERQFAQTRDGKLGHTIYDKLGQADSDNSEKYKQRRESDATICCFPGYWLLMLMLAIVVGAFFIILARSQAGLIGTENAEKITNNTSAGNTTSGNGTSGTSGGSSGAGTANNSGAGTGTSTSGSTSGGTGGSGGTSGTGGTSGSSSSTTPSTNPVPETSFQFAPTNPTPNTEFQSSFMFPPSHHLHASHQHPQTSTLRHRISPRPLPHPHPH